MILNLSHQDLDGVISSILVKKTFQDVKVIPCTYRTINDILDSELRSKDYDKVFITDISIDEKRFKPLIDSYPNKFFLIDHHPRETVSTLLNSYVKVGDDAACKMTSDYLEANFDIVFTDEMKRLVLLGDDYDTWKHHHKLSKYMNRLYFSIGFYKFSERFKDGFSGFNEDEKAFLMKNQKYIENFLNEIESVNLGSGILFADLADNIDEAAEFLLKTNSDIDTIFLYNGNLKKMSMRGIFKGVHFGDFLTKFGGGGHKTAAAVSVSTMNEVQKIIETYVELKERSNAI